MKSPSIGEVINPASLSQDHHVEQTPSSSWLGRKWTNLSSYVTKDNIAGLCLTGSALLGGYVSATADSIPELMDGVMIATAAASLVCFFWGMSCAIIDKQYSKAAKILVASGALGALSYGASEVSRIQSERRFQEEVDGLGWSEKLSTKPPRPTRSYPIKQQQAENWINAHPCAIQRETARKLVSATKHISQQKFEMALQNSVHQFNQWLDGEDYIIVTTEATQKKSNQWVASLALEHLRVLPKEVVTYFQAPMQNQWEFRQTVKYRLDHPDVRVAALFDDAAYSGAQLRAALEILSNLDAKEYCKEYPDPSCTLENIEQFKATQTDFTVALIVPFMRDPESILALFSSDKERSPIRIFTYERFSMISDALTEQEWSSIGITWPWKVTAYFDHKVADFMSIPDNAYEGLVYQPPNGCPEELWFWERARIWLTSTDTKFFAYGSFEGIPDVDTRFIEEIKSPYK